MRSIRWQVWVTLTAAVGVVLVVTNIILVERNRSLQDEVNARGQYIQQTMQLEGLHREIVNAIAKLAILNKDDALKTILTQQGITINPGQSQTTAPPPSGQARDAKGRR